MQEEPLHLSRQIKIHLLSLARKSIAHTVRSGKRLISSHARDGVLSEKRGVFVTLHKQGQLRGCVGYIEPLRSLQDAVCECAFSAAFCDNRFEPLREDELKDIDIEISCLTSPQQVVDLKEIVLGRHGIILKKGFAKAVFLPCVAVQEGWDLQTTLDHLCLKAGLGPGDWKDSSEIATFEAVVFGEKDFPELAGKGKQK